MANPITSVDSDRDSAESAAIPDSGSTPRTADAAFPIVGIGASAGGLEAITQLLAGLPSDTGMAFVLVQHLDPRHDSRLAEILGKSTRLSVREAVHDMEVCPNQVYVIPPNTTLTLAAGRLQLAARMEFHTPHLPIDRFFKSLALDRESGAIGVILSGTGSDGTLGLEEIKATGGITFAQDEYSAKFPTMPASAINSGCVDMVMEPAAIARELLRIGRHPYLVDPELAEQQEPADESGYHKVLALLRSVTGVDFHGYRDSTIRRRILRRMALHMTQALPEYVQQLEQDSAELQALYHDILINVTSFFRDPEVFNALKLHVFPEIVKNKSHSKPIRIWVPGCSSGQEPYSLAITLLEFLDASKESMPIQIFATDLSDVVALQKARDGVYPDSIEADVTPERLRRYFTKQGNQYHINKPLRDMCVFARQNVAADPPFSHVDLISCRNLLIYLAPPLQKRILPVFHYALNSPGFLLLGGAESIGTFSELFKPVDQKHRIFLKQSQVSRNYPSFTPAEIHSFGPGGARLPQNSIAWQHATDRLVVDQYAPAGMLVNENLEVLQFRGEIGEYITRTPGDAGLNALKMAREGLLLEIRSAVNEARERDTEIQRYRVHVKTTSGRSTEISIQVQPVKLPSRSERRFLVSFSDAPTRGGAMIANRGALMGTRGLGAGLKTWLASVLGVLSNDTSEQRDLRRELANTREYLQSVIEQQDAANEELKSANEEILSSNEELQSTNEELETAKEELQSINEELTTVNEQLQNRNLDLIQLNDDCNNLFASANVPMVALSADLRVRRFTPSAAKLLNLLTADIGRPIGNLKPKVDVPNLEDLITDVIQTVRLHEREVRDQDGRTYLLRIYPYRTADNRIDGAVVVLLDIDDLKQQAASLRQQAALIDLSPDAIIVRNADDLITFWNRGAEQMYGWSQSEAVGKELDKLLQTVFAAGAPDPKLVLREKGRWEGELIHTTRDGRKLTIESKQVVLRDDKGTIIGILTTNRDITARKAMEQDLRRYADKMAEIDRRRDEFQAMLAHELRNPLSPLRNSLHALRLIGRDSKPTQHLQEVMERQVRHMSRLIDDLLDVPRMTHGRIELRKEQVDLATVMSETVEDVRSYADIANRELVVKLPRETVVLEADTVRLTQIIDNLLTNAIKYTDRGGRIEVVATRERDDAVIQVRDDGIGISAEMLPKVWDLFTQADASLERARGGLGIGLTLVRHLVELHGGTISARSEGLGKGSEFLVRLPLAAEHQTRLRLTKPVVPVKSPPNTKPASRRILVVDDNVDAAQSLEMLLKLLNHETKVAFDGSEALKIVPDYRPEIVVLDIGMPGLNGYEVARRVRQTLGDQVYIVALTGYGAEEDRRRALDAGFDAHLVKPIEVEQLTQLMNRAKP